MEILNYNSKKVPPTAGDAYGEGWNIIWKTFVGLLAVTIISGIISGPTSMFQINIQENDFHLFMIPLALFAIGFGIFIAGPIGYSTKWVFLKAARGENYEIKDMFAVFERNYWNAVAGNVVVGLIVGIGILMLIVPGIIFACRLAFVPYLIIDRRMDLTEALNKSWEMTRGYGWQVFLIGFIGFFVVILGLIALIFGVIISIIWIQMASAVLYNAVVTEKGYFQAEPVQE